MPFDTFVYQIATAGFQAIHFTPFTVLVVPPINDPSLGERLKGDDIASVRRRIVGRLLVIARQDESLTIDG